MVETRHGISKMPTGIPGLDECLAGGMPRERTTLLMGGAGCGKTVLALQRLVLVLRLYVAGNAPHSLRARNNLEELADGILPQDCRIEVVDVHKSPDRALDDRILVTPTLFKASPSPVCRIIGDLSDHDSVVSALGLPIFS